MPLTDLEQARLDRLNDLLQLEDMAEDEIDYLARVPELYEPETEDALECPFDEETG